jgi:hypothetical protein
MLVVEDLVEHLVHLLQVAEIFEALEYGGDVHELGDLKLEAGEKI